MTFIYSEDPDGDKPGREITEMAGATAIGKSIPRMEGAAKATGEAKYTSDLFLPRMLIAKALRSPLPHARIVHIDADRARRLPGVKGVITGLDIPRVRFGANESFPEKWDQYAIAIEQVRYIGEEVAAVAAVDEDTALEALDLIDVVYEELPAVFDPEEALAPGAPRIHDVEANISLKASVRFGDPDRAFKESFRVYENRFSTQLAAHASFETHAALAQAGPESRVTLWSSTQAPFRVRRNLARCLNLAEDKVRVIKPYVGGGFGSKLELFASDFCCAFLSLRTGRPVKMVYSREEEFLATRYRHPAIIDLKTGVREDGTITARQCRIILDGGAYNGVGLAVTFLSTLFLNLPYRQRNIHFEALRVFTNKPVCGAMRGFGAPQVHFASEWQMDRIADDLGIDPMEIRLRNGLDAGETPGGMRIKSCGLKECLRQVALQSGWEEKRKNLPAGRGIGLACSGFFSGSTAPVLKTPGHYLSAAVIKLNPDGTVNLLSGASDIGQGSDTTLSQIAAEELGVGFERIRIVTADTELTPIDVGTFSAKVTLMAGGAVKQAAAEAKRQVFDAVASQLEIDPGDLEARGGWISVRGTPERKISFDDAIALCMEKTTGMPVVGRGFYHPDTGPTNHKTGEGNYSPAYTFSAAVAEVEVDEDSGQVKLVHVNHAHDCGFAINPSSVEGQLQGAISMGVGFALYEELIQRDGLMMNPSLLEYKIPTCLEMPDGKAIIVETHEPEGPFGAKECGEGIVSPIAPAIANALRHALGRKAAELPMTPERIIAACKK